MNADKYLKELTKRIENSAVRREIMREYKDHIEDCKETLMELGMNEEEAEEEAVKQMGDPASAGREMNRLYRRFVDIHMLLWFFASSTFILIATQIMKNQGDMDMLFPQGPRIMFIVLGGILLLYGLILSVWEKWNNLELFYAYAKDWGGGVANSGLILGIAVPFLADGWSEGIGIILAIAAVQTIIRSLVSLLSSRRETKLLWEIGIADTSVTYKGKGTFCGRHMKIKTKGEEIEPGTPVMIVSIEGSKPVVERV